MSQKKNPRFSSIQRIYYCSRTAALSDTFLAFIIGTIHNLDATHSIVSIKQTANKYVNRAVTKGGLNAAMWRIITQKNIVYLLNYDILIVKQPTRIMMCNCSLKDRKFKDSKNFRPMSACAECAGRHGSIHFANAF